MRPNTKNTRTRTRTRTWCSGAHRLHNNVQCTTHKSRIISREQGASTGMTNGATNDSVILLSSETNPDT